TWFTYGPDGNGIWLVGSNLAKTGPNTYSGQMYQTTGPSFDTFHSGNASQVVTRVVGFATFTFTDADNGTFTYSTSGITPTFTLTNPITRQVFSSPVPTCVAAQTFAPSSNYSDLWWRSPAGSENGWGVNITHQGDILFATWFTYDASGRGLWLVLSNGAKTGTN